MKIKNEKNFRVLSIFILVILLISICSIIAQDSGTTAPTAATGTAGSGTGTPISVPETAKEPAKVGDKIIPGAKPDTATIQGGTLTPAKDGKGGEFVAGGKGIVDGKKDVSLGANGDLEINSGKKDSKLDNLAEGSKVSIDEKGNVKDLDAKGVKADKPEDATKVKVSGKTTDTEVKLGEGDTIKKEKEQIDTIKGKDAGKSDVYSSQLKEGSKLEVKRTQKKEEDKEENDPYWKFITPENKFVGLSDEIAKQIGLPQGSKFSGTLTMDPQGNFFSDKATAFADSKGNQILKDYALGTKFPNVNERTYYFSKSEFDGAQGKLWKDNGGGSYVVSDDSAKKIALGSTNDKYSTYIELGKQNTYSNYQAGMMTGSKSEVSIQATTGGKSPIVKMQGNEAMFYGGEGVGFAKIGNNLYFKEGAKLSQIIPANAGVPSFSFDKNYKADVYSLGEGGKLITEPKKSLYVQSGISESGAVKNIVGGLDEKGNAIPIDKNPRVQGNEPPKDSKGFGDILKGKAKGILGSVPNLFGGGTPEKPGTVNPVPAMPEAGKNLLNSIKPSGQQVNVPLANGQSAPLFGTEGTYGGKGLVIVASQPGCGPCVALAQQLKGKVPAGVQVTTIDIRQNPNLAKQLGLQGLGTPSAVRIDPNTGKSLGNIITGTPGILGLLQSLGK